MNCISTGVKYKLFEDCTVVLYKLPSCVPFLKSQRKIKKYIYMCVCEHAF
jgi:hypothetical protein